MRGVECPCHIARRLNQTITRHLVCVNLKTGKKLWQQDVKASLPEDPYTGIGVTAHGYASHTPTSDGRSVYVFFGKSGIHAFDLDGKVILKENAGSPTARQVLDHLPHQAERPRQQGKRPIKRRAGKGKGNWSQGNVEQGSNFSVKVALTPGVEAWLPNDGETCLLRALQPRR